MAYVQAQQDVTMYSGPGEDYEEIGGVFDGQTALVTGQSVDGSWWRVICPDDSEGNCFVTANSTYTLPTETADPDASLPNPSELAMTVEQFPSPDGRWQATVSQSEPIVIDGNEKFYASIIVEDGTTTRQLTEGWRAYGLGGCRKSPSQSYFGTKNA